MPRLQCASKVPSSAVSCKVPCKPLEKCTTELHPCTEGKWRQDKGKLGKTNRHIKKACRLIICSLLCNSNLMHPKCQNPSNLPPGGSTQLHSPNQNTWCTSGWESTCCYLGIRGFTAEKTAKIFTAAQSYSIPELPAEKGRTRVEAVENASSLPFVLRTLSFLGKPALV